MNRAGVRASVIAALVAATLAGGATAAPEAIAAPAVQASASTSSATSALGKFWKAKSYPYSHYNGGNSPAGYEKGWCFDYGIWAWNHWTGTKFDHVSISKFKSVAKNRGYKISTKPKQGALAIWNSRGRHHAAYVLKYKSGSSTFTVREVRWNTVSPSNRPISVKDIGKSGRAPDYFIYNK